jgi:hypothetical protein
MRVNRSDYIVRTPNSRCVLDQDLRFAQVHEDIRETGKVKLEFFFPTYPTDGLMQYTSILRECNFASIRDWENYGDNLECAEKRLEELYGR